MRELSFQHDSLLTTIRALSWSAKHGAYPGGDPDLHHYVGSLLVKGAIDAFALVFLLDLSYQRAHTMSQSTTFSQLVCAIAHACLPSPSSAGWKLEVKLATTRSKAPYRASHLCFTLIPLVLRDAHSPWLPPSSSFQTLPLSTPALSLPAPSLRPFLPSTTNSLTLTHPHSYLLNGNILAARTFITTFVAQLPQSELVSAPPLQAGDSVQLVQAKDGVVNFCQAAVLACQRANGDRNKVMRESWVRLCGTYQSRGGALAQPEVRRVSVMVYLSVLCDVVLFRVVLVLRSFSTPSFALARWMRS